MLFLKLVVMLSHCIILNRKDSICYYRITIIILLTSFIIRVRALMRMTSMISSPPQPQTGFSQTDLFRGFSSIGNKVKIKVTYYNL